MGKKKGKIYRENFPQKSSPCSDPSQQIFSFTSVTRFKNFELISKEEKTEFSVISKCHRVAAPDFFYDECKKQCCMRHVEKMFFTLERIIFNTFDSCQHRDDTGTGDANFCVYSSFHCPANFYVYSSFH